MLFIKCMILNMIAVGKVSMYIDFQEKEVMPLLDGTLHYWIHTIFLQIITENECSTHV